MTQHSQPNDQSVGPKSDAHHDGLRIYKHLCDRAQTMAWRKVQVGDREIEAPAHFSQTAVEITERFYLRKIKFSGTEFQEHSIRTLLARVSASIAASVSAQAVANRVQFAEQVFDFLYEQKAAFNSPVWMNVGLDLLAPELRIHGRHFAWDAKSETVRAVDNLATKPQAAACFIQSIEDRLDSIYEVLSNEAFIFKFGSGSGSNFSALRAKGEPLSSGGESPGVLEFLGVFDRSAGALKSGGSTRRAAKMVILDADHPEIFEFISWKSREEKKAKALAQLGYEAGLDGEAYRSVSGQNSNNSVRLSDAVLEAWVRDEKISLRPRTTAGGLVEVRSARKLMRSIAQAIWDCADPGVQFSDTIERQNPVRNDAEIRATNPCAEFVFIDDTACNLASLNLARFFDGARTQFAVDVFSQTIHKLIQAQDALVDLASYPTEKIARRSVQYRPLGLGFSNLGTVLMAAGIPYDSELGRFFCAAVTSLMSAEATSASAALARVLGPFERFQANRDSVLQVLESKVHASRSLLAQLQNSSSSLQSGFGQMVVEIARRADSKWKDAQSDVQRFGIRNSQLTLIAPTGTISFFMDCDTTGIEPEFSLLKTKRLSGGGEIQLSSRPMHDLLARSGLSEADRVKLESALIGANLEQALVNLKADPRSDHSVVVETVQRLLPALKCAAEISPSDHLKMMQAAQPFLCGAISKTVNLASSVPVEQIESLIVEAWRLKLKCIAFYREGSKLAQPLVSTSSSGPVDVCEVCD